MATRVYKKTTVVFSNPIPKILLVVRGMKFRSKIPTGVKALVILVVSCLCASVRKIEANETERHCLHHPI